MSVALAIVPIIILLALWAALHDLAARSVPNWVPGILIAAGLSLRFHQGQLPGALLAFAIVLVLTFIAWRRGWMGGGDVKLFAAGALVVPPAVVPGQVLVISLAGGVLALCYVLLRIVVPRPAACRPASRLARILRCEQWRIRRGGPLPYACAIAAGIAFTVLQG